MGVRWKGLIKLDKNRGKLLPPGGETHKQRLVEKSSIRKVRGSTIECFLL